MIDLNEYGNEQMVESSSALVQDMNKLVVETKKFLMNTYNFEQPTYTQLQDTRFMMENYSLVLKHHSNVLDKMRNCEFYQSVCKDAVQTLSTDSVVNARLKTQINNISNRIKNLLDPLYTEERRMDRILRFYEKTYNTFM